MFGNEFKVNVKHQHMINSALPELVKASGGDNPKMTVESFNNHVYFYADVDTDRVLALIRQLREKDEWLRSERMSRDIPNHVPGTPIWLHIQSGGGDVFAGFSAANQIAEIAARTPIYAIGEGMVASAATFIYLACTRRYSLPDTFYLIHQVSSWMFGSHTYEALKDEMVLLDKIMSRIRQFYQDKTELGKDAIAEFLKRDTWLDAGEAAAAGIVHEIRGG